MEQTSMLSISRLIVPASTRSGRKTTSIGAIAIGGGQGNGTVVDLSQFLKIISDTEQVVVSDLAFEKDIKVKGVIVNKVTEDLNTACTLNGDGVEFYRFRSTAANRPDYLGIDDGFVQVFTWNQSNYAFQIAYDVDATGVAYRTRNELNIWSTWIKIANKEENINEYVGSAIDGTNKTFETMYAYKSMKVYLNGIRQFFNHDYEETNEKHITFVETPQVGDKIIFDYIKI